MTLNIISTAKIREYGPTGLIPAHQFTFQFERTRIVLI